MEQLSEIEEAARKLMLASKERYDRARSARMMRDAIEGMTQRAEPTPKRSSADD